MGPKKVEHGLSQKLLPVLGYVLAGLPCLDSVRGYAPSPTRHFMCQGARNSQWAGLHPLRGEGDSGEGLWGALEESQ